METWVEPGNVAKICQYSK